MLDNAPKAYLLESHCVFCIDKSELIVANKANLHLDNLESTLLHFLICNQNRLVRYEEFERFWKDRYFGDAVLTRVISAIRHKLKESRCTEIKIINKTKNGYILTGPIKPYVENKLTRHPGFIPVTAIFSMVLFGSLVYFTGPKQILVLQKTDKSYRHHDKIIKTNEVKHKFAFNYSKKLIAYVANSTSTNRKQLHIFDRLTETTITVEDQASAFSPVWLSDHQLVYRAVSHDKCHIKQIDLSSTFTISKSINLFRCNEKSIANALTRYQHNKLLSTNAVPNSAANTLSIADLNGLPCKTITFPQLSGLTIYEVVGHPDSDEVIILATSDWQSTRIIKTSMADDWRATWHYSPNQFVHSVSWDGKEVLLKDDESSVVGFSFPGPHIDKTRYVGIDTPFHSPSTLSGGIAFISNSGLRQVLVQHDVITKTKQTLLDIPENMVFIGHNSEWGLVVIEHHMSNRSTLSYYDKTAKRFEPIIQLPDTPNSAHMVFSADNSAFAYESGDNIVFVKFAVANKPTEIQRIVGSRPLFIDDTLYFLDGTSGTSQISTLNSITNLNTSVVTQANLFAEFENKLILSHKTKLGIWEVKPPFQSLLINTEFPVSKLLAQGNSIFYQLADGSNYLYKDGESTRIKLAANEQLVELNPLYFYSISTTVRDSSIAVLK